MNLKENCTYSVYGKKMKFIEQKQIVDKTLFLFDKQTFNRLPSELEEFYQNIELVVEEIEVNDPEIISSSINQKAFLPHKISDQAKRVCSDLDVISGAMVDVFKSLKDKESLTKEEVIKAQTMSKLGDSFAKMQLTKIAVKNNL